MMTSERALNFMTGQILMTMTLMTLTSCASVNPRAQAKGPNECAEPIAPRRGTYQLSRDEKSVEFFCQPGYTLIGSIEATCRSGLWSDQPPVCVGGDCNIPAVRDGSMVVLHGGGIVRIKCRTGYSLSEGSGILACIGGQWNSTTPQCNDGKQQGASGKKASKDAKLVGKHPKSDSKTEEKRSHVEWMQEADYSCVRSDFTVYPPSVPNARAFTRWALEDGSPRLYTTYQCKWGFKQTGGGASNVYCVNSTWIGSTPKCQTVVYEDPEQGDILGGNARRLSHNELLLFADYSCINTDAKDGIEAPVIANALSTLKFVILEGRPHLYTEYTCSGGYELEKEKLAYVYCKRKSWIGDLPKCVPAKSRQLCAVKNGGCDQLCKLDDRRLIVCSCKAGFVLQPDQTTCTDLDECEVNSGDCDHLCDNTQGSFKCSCFAGYTLHSDRKSCNSNRTSENDTRN